MTADERAWVQKLNPYRNADNSRAIFEILVTLVPFLALWGVMYYLMHISYFLMLALAPLAGLLIVRLFIIQHDCGHKAMFSSRAANNWVGRCMGVLTLTPYEYWRYSHALHHAGSGNLDKRGFGDIETLTVAEYKALPALGKLRYWLYRNPVMLFVVGPAYLFIIRHRFPLWALSLGRDQWISIMGTNVSIAIVYGIVMYFTGVAEFLMIQLPIVAMGASIGVWLFFIQHQFDDTQWDHSDDWQHEHSALHGSSYYDLPAPLMWLTGYIGIHHVHHLQSRVPFHKLPQVIEDFPELKEIGRLSFMDSLKCIPLSLWDEKSRQLISFRQAAQQTG